MSEETVYTIRLDKDTRKEWSEFVEDSEEFSSTSQLIRTSVSQQINSSDGDLDKDLLEVNDQILQEIARLMRQLDQIKSISSNIHEQTQSGAIQEIVEQSTLNVLEEHERLGGEEENE